MMSNPGGRPIEPKGSAGVEMSGQMGTTGRRCALYATLRPGKNQFKQSAPYSLFVQTQ
jgi:hypothetical protein